MDPTKDEAVAAEETKETEVQVDEGATEQSSN